MMNVLFLFIKQTSKEKKRNTETKYFKRKHLEKIKVIIQETLCDVKFLKYGLSDFISYASLKKQA